MQKVVMTAKSCYMVYDGIKMLSNMEKLFCYDYRNLEDEATAFDNKSSSTIKLNNGTVLYLREVNRCLALVCILREESFDKQGRANNCPNH